LAPPRCPQREEVCLGKESEKKMHGGAGGKCKSRVDSRNFSVHAIKKERGFWGRTEAYTGGAKTDDKKDEDRSALPEHTE